jgi:hypothetical protein
MFFSLFRCLSYARQLNQDFALIRQKIIEGERPKFEDPTAPAE